MQVETEQLQKTPFERWMLRVWQPFQTQICDRPGDNRLLTLALHIFRSDLQLVYERRLPSLDGLDLEDLYLTLAPTEEIQEHHHGLYVRLAASDSISYTPDPAESSDGISPEALIDMALGFLSLMVVNEAFPTGTQLTEAELYLIRNSLIGERILTTQVAGLAERKFQLGWFGQARLLLTLFQSSDIGWAREEQRMFYEEFILNFGVRRRTPLPADLEQHIQDELTPDEPPSRKEALQLIEWIAEHTGIRLVTLHYNPSYSDDMRRIVGTEPDGHSPRLGDLLPALRWRPLNQVFSATECNLPHLLYEHSLQRYVIRHMSSVFVILRAHGSTGLEPYAQAALAWLQKTLGIAYIDILPTLYRKAMTYTQPLAPLFHSTFFEHFSEQVHQRFVALQEDDFTNIFSRLATSIRSMNLKDIAPGNYDFTGFVYDTILNFEYPSPEHVFFIHRIN